MLSKSKTTKALLYSTAALSLFAASHVHADETSHWTARSVDQIKADISVTNNQQTYTVKYGDTLSSIAEAMKIDVNVLGNICLLYTSPSPRDVEESRMPSSA